MSNKGKKGSSKAGTALGVIMERLDSLSEHDYIATTGRPEEGDTIVGEMPDYLRRLATLRSLLASEYNAIVRQVNFLGQQVERAQENGGKGLDGLLFVLRGGLSIDTVEKLKERMAELSAKEREVEFFDSLFWFEVRAAFPELADKTHIGIFSDWRVGWKKVTRRTIETFIERHLLPDFMTALEGSEHGPESLHDALHPGPMFRRSRSHAHAD